MSSKQISYKVTGRDNEQYTFLDRLEDGTYQVREGTSTPVSHMEWEESFSTYSLEEFLSGHPQHRSKVEELIAEFEAE